MRKQTNYQVTWFSKKEATWLDDFPYQHKIFVRFSTGFSLAEPNSSLPIVPLKIRPQDISEGEKKNPFSNVVMDVENDMEVHFPAGDISAEGEATATH